MTADLFQCPSCGAPVTPKKSAAVINCPYCHASVVVPEELRKESGSAKWSTLVYDGFLSNHNDWVVGGGTGEYFTWFNHVIADGRYRWSAKVAKSTSITSSWLTGYPVTDFHLIANCKQIRGDRSGSGWGVIFRIKDNDNYYNFHIIDDRQFAVSMKKEGKWTMLVDWTKTNTVKPGGVNQVEVIANENHFTCFINGQNVAELDDDQFREGLVGLAMEGYTVGEEIIFDFLDITLRAP